MNKYPAKSVHLPPTRPSPSTPSVTYTFAHLYSSSPQKRPPSETIVLRRHIANRLISHQTRVRLGAIGWIAGAQEENGSDLREIRLASLQALVQLDGAGGGEVHNLDGRRGRLELLARGGGGVADGRRFPAMAVG